MPIDAVLSAARSVPHRMLTGSYLRSVSITALLAALAPAQTPPGVEPPGDTSALDAVPAANGPADARWQVAKAALQQGLAKDAIVPLLSALELHPDSPPLLLDMVRATADDADAQQLWIDRLWQALADEQGRVKLDVATRKLLTGLDTKAVQNLATLRAQAATELARAAERLKGSGRQTLGNGVTARWLGELFLLLADDAPALLRRHGPGLQQVLGRQEPELDLVLRGLRQLLHQGDTKPGTSPTTGATPEQLQDRALRAARITAGLARQAGFGKDLQGPPPPDLGDLPQLAAAFLQRFHDEVTQRAKVWTTAELSALAPAERLQFTQQHRDWRNPGVAESPNRRYRIETVCGAETLLAAAQTVELHHARLVDHFGKDPFVARQGTVRIVPESAELETEGAPFWWAGGFQGGDRTVIRFAWGNVPGMGRTLTHELTHRFDGTLHPFVGSWYSEGHACWTAAHYARMADTKCVEGWLDRGTCAHTYYKGYAGIDKLTQLLTGKIEDYRDNYFAGYSLYAFLRGYPTLAQQKLFAGPLLKFENNARAGQKEPLAWFLSCFCDGKDSRPEDLPAFVALWAQFLRDCYDFPDKDRRSEQNAWVGRIPGLGKGDRGDLVLDEPTWSWARSRAEPCFGDGHAGEAGLLLLEAGNVEAAAAALLWSLQVEGWQPRTALPLPPALQQLSRKDAAFAAQCLARERYPTRLEAPTAPTPMLPQLPRTRAFCDALGTAAAAQAAVGRHVAAAALEAQAQRLLLLLGLPAAASSGELAPPSIPRALAGYGFDEDGLTGFEDRRVQGLWYATPEGDLHVGRDKPRDATGLRDRASHQRDAFVRTVQWLQPGEYTISARIHFTTAFASGAVVFGHSRRDRDLRLTFRAGDYQFAIGKSDQDGDYKSVHVGLQGLWERDGPMLGNEASRTVEFAQPKSWFDLQLLVRGPSVLVKVDGESLFRYTMHDGSPIEGSVGFAMGMGAIRVQQATVQRLDQARPGSALAAVAAVGLDIDQPAAGELDDLLLLPTRGIPTAAHGTLLLWLPPADGDNDPIADLPRALPVLAKLLKDTVDYPQPWLLVVPKGTAKAKLDEVQGRLAEFRPQPLPVLEHLVKKPFTGEPWVMFVDATGVLRAAAEMGDPGIFTRVQHWAGLFRAR